MNITRENCLQLIPLIQAFHDGELELRYRSTEWIKWCDPEMPEWTATTAEFRRRPAKRLRPWKPEEVPVGAVARSKDHSWRALITGSRKVGAILDGALYDFGALLSHGIEYQPPGTTEWKPCGVYEEGV